MRSDKWFTYLVVGIWLMVLGFSMVAMVRDMVGFFQLFKVSDTQGALSILGDAKLQGVYAIKVLKYVNDYGISLGNLFSGLWQWMTWPFYLSVLGTGVVVVVRDDDWRALWVLNRIMIYAGLWVMIELVFGVMIGILMSASTSQMVIDLIRWTGGLMIGVYSIGLLVQLVTLLMAKTSWLRWRASIESSQML